MNCRPNCGACCIAPSISSPIPALDPSLPALPGKPAASPCHQLDGDLRCKLFGRPDRPAVCASLLPSEEMCGTHQDEALLWLTRLEFATQPQPRCRG
jgi:Fe-S-cluster containining protein